MQQRATSCVELGSGSATVVVEPDAGPHELSGCVGSSTACVTDVDALMGARCSGVGRGGRLRVRLGLPARRAADRPGVSRSARSGGGAVRG